MDCLLGQDGLNSTSALDVTLEVTLVDSLQVVNDQSGDDRATTDSDSDDLHIVELLVFHCISFSSYACSIARAYISCQEGGRILEA